MAGVEVGEVHISLGEHALPEFPGCSEGESLPGSSSGDDDV